ncbi:MAG: flagellar basal body P-ring formation protein FlgA [Candidatus Delongbacteria bacterium]|nr:flagellar basal body P-ring formation protein FlgA [Candidatus Delongbacteria bacterium]
MNRLVLNKPGLTLLILLIAAPFCGGVATADLLEEVAQQLVQRSSVWHDSVQVDFRARGVDWPPTGVLQDITPLSEKLRGTIVVDARLRDGSSLRLTAKVRTWDRLWSAACLIDGGETIFSDMITPRLVETTRLRQDILQLEESPVGMVARRRIQQRDLLAHTALEPPQAVKAGSEVRLRLQYGQVVLEDSGSALQGGGFGEQILVRSGSTGKVLQGNITPSGVVLCRIE